MADVTNTDVQDVEVAPRPALLPARQVDLRRSFKAGLVGGGVMALVSAIGMLHEFERNRVVGDLNFAQLVMIAIVVGFGFLASRLPVVLEGYEAAKPGPRNLLAGAISGVGISLPILAFVWIFGNRDLRWMFTNLRPADVDRLTFDRGLVVGAALAVVAAVLLATLGGALQLLERRWRRPLVGALVWTVLFGLAPLLFSQLLTGLRLGFIERSIYVPAGALTVSGAIGIAVFFFLLYSLLERFRGRARATFQSLGLASDPAGRRPPANRALLFGLAGALFIFLGTLPQVLGHLLSATFVIAGIYMLAALGLNIVVGFAGLLDLGYVAFFAVGAYTMAVLTSPLSPRWSPELGFWQAMPFVILAAAIAGIIVGTPVLRMRGDYLAIVTLAFGEIARVLLMSDWLTPMFGGAQGIVRVPPVSLGAFEFAGPQRQLYPIIFFILFAAYASWALQRSRVGRAWMAMREDESVAEAMGVNIVSAKLSAFVIGAILASFAGALAVTRIGSAFPHDFDIVVSITFLVVIIVGGIASVPGVMVGALVLVALPELLREFDEFRFLIYGALLIIMMVNRPEGFIPSARRARELHEEDAEQDAWLRASAEGHREAAAQEEA